MPLPLPPLTRKRLMPPDKKMEDLEQQKAGDNEDRISNLPDEILTCILSYLSTKEVIRTGILSTRWKSIWASVPTICLPVGQFCYNAECFGTKEDRKVKANFWKFVDRVLKGHIMPFVENIAIEGSIFLTYDIQLWIIAAIERNVRELQLLFHQAIAPGEFPEILFSCNTLVVLKLDLEMVLNFPRTCTCFPNLKVLKLHRIIYKDDHSAQNLFSSCPVLEDLDIVRSEFDNLRTLNVTTRVLKKLSVVFRRYIQHHQHKFMIDASALESIHIKDAVTQDYVVRDLSSLIKAKLEVSNCGFPSQELALVLLQGISNVKFLALSCSTMLSISLANAHKLPEFYNLTCLEVRCAIFMKDNSSWKLVLEFLKKSPILEVLVFEEFLFSWNKKLGTSWDCDVPSCLLSHLKRITIMGYHLKRDLDKVGYLLLNAKVLEKITINIKKGLIQNKAFMLAEELQRLPRGSRACQMVIC